MKKSLLSRFALVWLSCLTLGGTFVLLRAASEPEAVVPISLRKIGPREAGRLKNIEDVRAGDRVWCFDPQNNEWRTSKVISPLTREYHGNIVSIRVLGEATACTAEHPFWVQSGTKLQSRPLPKHVPAVEQRGLATGRWVEAQDLQVGDLLLLKTGDVAPVEMLTLRENEREQVFDLEVADVHTYAVGSGGVAVHNCPGATTPCFPTGTEVLMGDGSYKSIETVKVGDSVLAQYPGYDLSPTRRLVVALSRSSTLYLYHITVLSDDGTHNEVVATGGHPFWTANEGWKPARSLRPNDLVVDHLGHTKSVFRNYRTEGYANTYNLQVATSHTFFVRANELNVLVHNALIRPGDKVTVNPQEVNFSHPNVTPQSAFSHGPLQGQSVGGVAQSISETGVIPEGLNLSVGVYNDGAVLITANNRSLLALQMANVPELPATVATDKMIQAQLRNRLWVSPQEVWGGPYPPPICPK